MNKKVILCIAICGLALAGYGAFNYQKENEGVHVQAKVIEVSIKTARVRKPFRPNPYNLYICNYVLQFQSPEGQNITTKLENPAGQCFAIGKSVSVVYNPASDNSPPQVRFNDTQPFLIFIILGLMIEFVLVYICCKAKKNL